MSDTLVRILLDGQAEDEQEAGDATSTRPTTWFECSRADISGHFRTRHNGDVEEVESEPRYITSASWNERGHRVATVWIIGGPRVAETEMHSDATLEETWDAGEWLVDRIVEQELYRDHQDTIQSAIAASYHV